jgi:hypothetical protein
MHTRANALTLTFTPNFYMENNKFTLSWITTLSKITIFFIIYITYVILCHLYTVLMTASSLSYTINCLHYSHAIIYFITYNCAFPRRVSLHIRPTYTPIHILVIGKQNHTPILQIHSKTMKKNATNTPHC